VIVMDGVGIGEMPDADRWGDAGSDTLGHVLASERPGIPNLAVLGMSCIRQFPNLPAPERARGCFGRAATRSNGKDTTVGHWEMAGILSVIPFPTYPEGFPPRIIERFEMAIGRGVLGNRAASGTEIIKELGDEHVRTGKPIVYTSADSVFQIAAHEGIIPLEELYGICRIARQQLDGADRVARVIARPFEGESGSYRRTSHRYDFAIPPPEKTLLDILKEADFSVATVGKIASIFDGLGITDEIPAHTNEESMAGTLEALGKIRKGLIFANFGDFDTLWGHRNDRAGFARGLETFDRWLPQLMERMGKSDCLIITADHGCDPTTAGTDHSREYTPLLVYGPSLKGGVDLGTRTSQADIGQTIAENFGMTLHNGKSFLTDLV
jgi:phosphopentomutase